MRKFIPINRMQDRVALAKDDSDTAYYYDLLLLGEMVTKITALFLLANLNEDTERNRYRFEYNLVRAGGIGDFASTINDIVTGNASNALSSEIRDRELRELTMRAETGMWQWEALNKLSQCLDAFDASYNKVTTKSSLKIWFYNFSTLRNKTKGHGAPTAKVFSKASPLLQESIDLIFENLSLFQRPWAFLHQNLSGKYRVSAITDTKSQFDYLKRENDAQYEEGVYCYTDQPRRIKLIYSDPDLLKFQLPNGNFNLNGKFEVLAYFDDQKDFVDGNDYLTPPTNLPESITRGKRSLDVVNESFSNLPPGIPDYIVRPELEYELETVLLDKERFPVVTLKGRGGIGKTSLAIHVINKISKIGRFDIIVWFSARDVDLFEDGPRQVQATVLNQSDISREYFNLIDPGKPSPKNVVEAFSNELSRTSGGAALYIFDNFETVTCPVEVFEWLNTFIRLPNKILITSRLSRNFKADYPIEVKGMSYQQCRKLIETTARKYSIEGLIDEVYKDKLIDESDGHPYIIKIILGEVAKSRRATEIKRIVADKDKILEALFKRTYATLSSAAKRIFLTLCSWRSVVPQLALEAVILREENDKMDVEAALDELNKSSFIELLEDKGETFVSVPLVAIMYGKLELEVYPEKLQIQQDKNLLMEFGAISKSGGVTSGLAGHIEKKFRAVGRRIKSSSDLAREIPTLEYIASKYSEAWRLIADMYKEYEDYTKEKEACREFLKSTDNIDKKLECWGRLADICQHTDDWSGESSALLSQVNMPNVSYTTISKAAWRVNNYYTETSNNVDRSIKEMLVKEIITAMEKRITEADATDYSRLAWLYINLGDEVKALKYAQKGIEKDPYNIYCNKLCDKLSR